jgi:hypothetical protein
MLRHLSNGEYLDAIRWAEKFILHVEVLFATIVDLEFHFASLMVKGMYHISLRMSNSIIPSLIGAVQACLMFEKRGCYAVKRLNFSHSCPIRRKQVHER